jgi:hypothetical protein
VACPQDVAKSAQGVLGTLSALSVSGLSLTPVQNATLAHYTKYQEQDLTPCIKHLNNVMKNRFNPPMKELKAITSKYWEKNLYSVARIPAVNLD